MYKIVTDSSSDLLSLPGVHFAAVPLTISTDERVYTDDASLDCSAMLKDLENYRGRSFTACPSTEGWVDAFAGADEIYIITMTGTLSGTFNAARLAADLYQTDHPEVRFCMIDSLTTGPELRLLIEEIVRLKEAGLSMVQVQAAVQEYMSHTRLLFAFASLHNFAQNGRVSKLLASTLGALGICIIGTASREGTIEAIGKCRGERKIIAKLIDEAVKARCSGRHIRITHVENPALAEKIAAAFQKQYPDADILTYPARGIVTYYGERDGVIVAFD